MIEVNLNGQYRCLHHAVPMLRQSKAANIVCISSIAGRMGIPWRTPYVVSKWAIVDLLIGKSYQLAPGLAYSNIYESADSVGDKTRDWRYKNADAYVQDNYRLAKRLTLNLGLRYEHLGDLGDAKALSADVNPANINPNPPATGSYGGYEVASNYSGGVTLPAGVVKGGNTFGMKGHGQDVINPRLGFAYVLPGGDNVVSARWCWTLSFNDSRTVERATGSGTALWRVPYPHWTPERKCDHSGALCARAAAP